MPARRLFLLLFFLSGAASLLYEVLWLRLLTLYMGQTVGAVGTVLAAFMGGLALGAALAGRIAPSLSEDSALRTYAWLELTIGACALLLPFALSGIQPVLAWAYQNGNGGSVFGGTRAVSSLLLLCVPTAAMGATYPLAVRWFTAHANATAARLPVSGYVEARRPASAKAAAVRRSFSEGGSLAAAARASGLYAANTAGAAVGAALGGFVMLPMLGLGGATLVGVGLNGTTALGALVLARRAQAVVPEGRRDPASTDRPSAPQVAHGDGRALHDKNRTARSRPESGAVRGVRMPPVAQMRLAAAALGISGFVALVHEVTWTRILAPVLGPTTYAFSAMLVAFITGLAIGSTLAAALLRRVHRPGVWLGSAIGTAAVAAQVLCWRVDRLPLAVAAVVARPDVTFWSVLLFQAAFTIALLLPVTIALGAAFPLAIALGTSGAEEAPREVATVYSINTVGAIAGALAGSFLLIPALGLQGTVRIAGALAIATGLTVSWLSLPGRGGRTVAAIVSAMAMALAIFMPPWNRELLSSGAYTFARYLAEADLESGLEAGRLLYYREGASGTISVKQLGGTTSLAIDGKVDASNGGDMLTQKLLAHLPLLLHSRPRSVCIIGLGSGVTLGAALRHPIDRADVVEISPEVVEASEYFATENDRALRDRRTRLIVGDGRSHLLLSRDRYDVIISEPSNPWLAGVAALFTREFFQAVRERLAPSGILSQWAHTYNISDEDLRSIVATFLSVFPDGTAWLIGEGDLLLIGSAGPLTGLDRGLLEAWARPGVAADLAKVAVRDPFSVLTLFVARGPELQRYAGNAPAQSDDRLLLEYSAPLALYGRFQSSNVAKLRELAGQSEGPPAVKGVLAAATAAEWRNRGLMQLGGEAPQLAYDDFRKAVAKAPRDVEALDGLARAAARVGRLGDADAFLREVAAKAGSVPALIELSTVLAARGRIEEAAQAAQQAVSLEPANAAALEQLASVYADQGDEEALERLVRSLDRADPDQALALYCETRLSYLRGDFERAAQFGEKLVALQRADATAFNLLGSVYAALGQNDRARRAFEHSLKVNPRDPAVLVNLGLAELRAADPAAAAKRFAEALVLYPTLAPALTGLADALEQQGYVARAAKIRSFRPGR